MQVYAICSLQIIFYVFLCYTFVCHSFVCYSFALFAFVFYVFVFYAFVLYVFVFYAFVLYAVVFYALYSMHYILCKVILKLVTDGPTDRPTDGQTLPDIELLSQLKIWKLKTASFFSKRKTTSNKLKMENDLIFLKMGDNLLSKVLRSEPPSPYYYFYCIFRWISFKIFKFLKWIQISDKFSKVLRLHPLSHHSYFLLHF